MQAPGADQRTDHIQPVMNDQRRQLPDALDIAHNLVVFEHKPRCRIVDENPRRIDVVLSYFLFLKSGHQLPQHPLVIAVKGSRLNLIGEIAGIDHFGVIFRQIRVFRHIAAQFVHHVGIKPAADVIRPAGGDFVSKENF